MTGLPYASAQTTGTVAVAKWGRITLLSPRASHHGYAWRDTLAHELTHLAVTRATRDLAPLWLQEGVAKREEVRWRAVGPFDDKPPPDAVAERGIELRLAPALDKMGPSIAMLPSASAAMVAFAEVTSFPVRFYVDTQGPDALPKLLAELKRGKGAEGALLAASGADLKNVGWPAGARTSRRVHGWPCRCILAGGGHGADAAAGTGDDEPDGLGGKHDAAGWRELRERSRLGELLLARDHAAEALTEFAQGDTAALAPGAGAPAASDPSLRWLRARALEAADRADEARALVGDPQEVAAPFASWWATRGRLVRKAGDEPSAVSSFLEAISADPFDLEAACETTSPTQPPMDLLKTPLCDAARARGEPVFGGD